MKKQKTNVICKFYLSQNDVKLLKYKLIKLMDYKPKNSRHQIEWDNREFYHLTNVGWGAPYKRLCNSPCAKLRHQLVDHDLVATETPHLDPNKISPFQIICYRPLEMKCNEEVIWTNPVPNSAAFSRPVSLCRAKEERSVLEVETSE